MTKTLTPEGLLRRSPGTIFTYGGGMIEPLDPNPEDINIVAVAHALSCQCRWTGHVTRFYSVAEHSVHVSKIEPSLEALLHDASEAYLSDLARPVKHAPGLGEVYLEAEKNLERAIAEKFDLEWPWTKTVKDADDAMLRREAEQLVPHLGRVMDSAPKGTPRVRCWTPIEAEERFLDRFEELGGVA